MTISEEIVLNGASQDDRRDYANTANVTATSLPTGTVGEGDSDFERDGSSGIDPNDRFSATNTALLESARVPEPAKTFTDSTDAFTELNPTSGEITIGEEVTVEITFTIPEGTMRDVRLQDRISLNQTVLMLMSPSSVPSCAATVIRLTSGNNPW